MRGDEKSSLFDKKTNNENYSLEANSMKKQIFILRKQQAWQILRLFFLKEANPLVS